MYRVRRAVVQVRDEIAAMRIRKAGSIRNPAGIRIYLNPADYRARRIFRCGGAMDGGAVQAWRLLHDRLSPEVLLDVGANYGEVLLSIDPSRAELALAIEPNPDLVPYLKKSAAPFSNVVVVVAAASDSNGIVSLNRDVRSSGLSSLERIRGDGDAVEVTSVRIDDLSVPDRRRLLFKIDVEGHEEPVIRGMSRTLAGARAWAGIVEINENAPLDFAPYAYRVIAHSGALVRVDPSSRQLRSERGLTKDAVVASVSLTQ